MQRREFITLFGCAAATWPFAARAQQAAMPLVGFLAFGSSGPFGHELDEFRLGLGDTGYVEGQSVAIEYRWAEGQIDRLPGLALDLVRRHVSVIVAVALPAANAIKDINSDIPVVFQIGGDPVKLGLVESLNKPGGNFTGFTQYGNLLAPKQLELLHEAVPKATKIGMLTNPANPNSALDVAAVQAAAQALGLQLVIKEIRSEKEVEPTFADLSRNEVGALLVSKTMGLGRISEQIIAIATQNAIPAIYAWREDAIAGGLITYGTDDGEMLRQVGTYVGRILRGKKPAELPVQQPSKVQLIVNLKTARAIGLTLPLTLLGRADEVIE
jgi:putative ABC transport system substrate-binding protein